MAHARSDAGPGDRTQLTDYPNVGARAQELGLVVPMRIALLPRNFLEAKAKSDLVHESTAPTVRTLLRQAHVTLTPIERDNERLPCVQENAFEWIGPTLFVGAALMTQDPNSVSVALGVVANYVTDFFKGIPGRKAIRMAVVVEKSTSKKCVRIDYEGPPDGLAGLAKIVREVSKHE